MPSAVANCFAHDAKKPFGVQKWENCQVLKFIENEQAHTSGQFRDRKENGHISKEAKQKGKSLWAKRD